MEEKYLTVSALTKYIKYKFDCDRHLLNVLLEGEISNFKHHSRGHFYFTLKDDQAQISAMMFQSYASKVKFEPKDGMKVYVKGQVTVYEAGGSYQINVKEMSSNGEGDLYLAYEKLKKELAEIGLFDEAHKKPIPKIPKTVGVITSPTGAAVHDIINTINRRFPLCKIILYPALVQGENAKESIVDCIHKANSDMLCDVLICGRGGGSIEDLWAFNEKIVAYAIYESTIPIISAVGHEVDFTIADFVADKRAATPTAAAEIATPSIADLKEKIKESYDRINYNIKVILENKKTLIANYERRLDLNNPKEKLKVKRNELNSLSEKLNLLISHTLNEKKNAFNILKDKPNELIKNLLIQKRNEYRLLNEKLNALSPLNIMDKGYSIALKDNNVIKSVSNVKKDDNITLNVKDGKINCVVKEVLNNGK